ncbi:hypothetical protein ACIBEJ_34245 [Nonomuraea sp. NPDC050790]|uniref:hypothetical protein n=1 Tax=Nonomuraea sp. NPDC050790 TaxID=3364371 RepID=UPI0037ACB19A
MLNRILTAFAAVLIVIGLTVPGTSAAADVPGLRVGTIGYNAHGPDVADNRNAEFVDVVNDSTAGVSVVGLLIQDSWARGNNRTSRCNTTTLAAGALPVTDGQPADVLPAGHTLRVFMGSGTASVDGTVHKVFRNMDSRCGLNGHHLNNGPGGNRWAPWDTVWITLGGNSESRSYNFTRGYTA